MKNTVLFLFALLISTISIAQNGINYKALIKDANGDVLVSQGIFVQFQILENGTLNVYQETHDTTTDANGIVVINIGEGTVNSGNFLTVDWGSGDHFLNVQVDSGDGFVDLGTTQFKSVPYAMMAETVEKSPVSDFALVKAFNPAPNNSSGKLIFSSEDFDITNNFDPGLSRFTVTEAGYYSIIANNIATHNGVNEIFISRLYISKNGSEIKYTEYRRRTVSLSSNNNFAPMIVSSIEYLVPGDYIEIYNYVNSGTQIRNSTLEIERIR